MAELLSITEVRLVRSLLSKKTDDELAAIIGRPVDVVHQAIGEMTGVGVRPNKKKVGEKKEKPFFKRTGKQPLPKPAKKTAKKKADPGEAKLKVKQKLAEQQRKAETKRRLDIERERQDRLKRRIEAQRIPDRKLDLTDKVVVRLNHKTFVYVTPGTDIEALKKRMNIN